MSLLKALRKVQKEIDQDLSSRDPEKVKIGLSHNNMSRPDEPTHETLARINARHKIIAIYYSTIIALGTALGTLFLPSSQSTESHQSLGDNSPIKAPEYPESGGVEDVGNRQRIDTSLLEGFKSISPHNPSQFAYRARLFALLDMFKEARADAEVVFSNPECPIEELALKARITREWAMHASTMEEMQLRLDEALKEYQRLMASHKREHKPSSRAIVGIEPEVLEWSEEFGDVYESMGELKKAIECYELVAAHRGNSVRANEGLFRCYLYLYSRTDDMYYLYKAQQYREQLDQLHVKTDMPPLSVLKQSTNSTPPPTPPPPPPSEQENRDLLE